MAVGVSKPLQSTQPPSPERQGVELLHELDWGHSLREQIHIGTQKIGEWAGCPLPLEGEELIIHPSYPFAHVFNKKEDPEDPKVRIRNRWYSNKYGTYVVVTDDENGRPQAMIDMHNRLTMEIRTMGIYPVWGIEQEARALNLLGELVTHAQFRSYMLTGRFIEMSRRSGLFYIFRRLKPTMALKNDGSKVLAALCMHPIGFYAGTFAGSMCPTDEVVAHLTLMRGDEHFFWKKANQHPAWVPEAGI